VLSSCSLFKKDNGNTTGTKKTNHNSNLKWKGLSDVLDFYDEVKSVKSDFKLETYIDGSVSISSGTYEYIKGESKWFYTNEEGKVGRIVECFVDKAVVKQPAKRRRRRRRRRRSKSSKESKMEVIATVDAKYPCVLQALIHYSGALNRNRLDREGKIFLVNTFDKEKRRIKKVTMVKNGKTLVYTFSNFKFTPMDGEVLPWNKKPEVKKPVTNTKDIKKAADKEIPDAAKKPVEKKKPDVKKPVEKKKPIDVSADDETPPM